MTSHRLAPLLALLLIATGASAQLSLFDWTLKGSFSGSGTVTANSLIVTGPDGSCSFPSTWFETVAEVGGTVTVSVEFQNLDSGAAQGHPEFDAPAAYLNGDTLLAAEVAPGDGWPTGSYELQLVLDAGDAFGFGVWSLDCQEGPGVAEFKDLVFTPEPWSEQLAGLDPRVRFSFAGAPPLGKAVAASAAGDVDDDGVPDLIIGTTGEAVVRSGATGVLLRKFIGSPAASYGDAVAGAGDVDGDGRDDLIVGAQGDNTLFFNGGSAWVYSGLNGALLYEYHGAADWERLGAQVAGVGDVDADGFGDFAIRLAVVFDSHLERVLVISGASGAVLHTLMTPGPSLQFGDHLAGVGDVDADGHDDVGVGCDAGARIYSGKTGNLIKVLGSALGNRVSVAGAGDVDGDGFDDVLVGGRFYTATGQQLGRVRLFSMKTLSGIRTFTGVEPGGGFGAEVAGGADFDGDGRLDVVIASPDAGLGGRVEIFDALDGTLRGTLLASGPDDGLGEGLGHLGDVDGDGQGDLLVRAPMGELDAQGFVRIYQKLDRVGPPRLVGTGSLVAGAPLQLSLTDALPDALSWFLLGTQYLGEPFLGGILGPLPVAFRAYVTDGTGSLQLAGIWPAGIPAGTTVWVQAWVTDADAPLGYSGSNAVGASQL